MFIQSTCNIRSSREEEEWPAPGYTGGEGSNKRYDECEPRPGWYCTTNNESSLPPEQQQITRAPVPPLPRIPAPGDPDYVYSDYVTKRNPNDNDKEGDPIPEAIEEVQEEVEEEETKDRVPIMEIF